MFDAVDGNDGLAFAESDGRPTDPLLTIPEAADRLSCSRAHVYRLLTEGTLRGVDISTVSSGRTKTRLIASEVDRFIASRTEVLPSWAARRVTGSGPADRLLGQESADE